MMAIDEVHGNVPLSVRASTWGSESQLPTELAKPWLLPESPATKLDPETLKDMDFIRLFLEHNPRPMRRGGSTNYYNRRHPWTLAKPSMR